MPLHRELSVSGVLLGTLLFTRILLAQNPAADLVLIHGHILTVDANDSVAQAIAVRHGVIVKVGTDAEVLEFAGNAPGTRIIDLHGHAATPGLIDTHAHIADGGVEELYGVKLSDAASVAEIVARVKAKIALVKPGEWVTGSGWDEGKLAEHRYVTATDLDAVAPTIPFGSSTPPAITESPTRSPSSWPIPPPAQRTPLLAPSTATPTATPPASSKKTPRWGPSPASSRPSPPIRCVRASSTFKQVLHSEGMTAVKDPDIYQLHWDAYKSLLDQGQLKERICVLWHAGSTLESARKALAEINAVPRLPSTLGDDCLLLLRRQNQHGRLWWRPHRLGL